MGSGIFWHQGCFIKNENTVEEDILVATLRITKIKHTPSVISLKVEGVVVAESVRVLEEECMGWLQKVKTVQLDFSGVTFIGHEGVRMLGNMPAEQLQILHCPGFIQHLLNLRDQA